MSISTLLSLDDLESFNSLSDLERENLLSTVPRSELPSLLGRLYSLEEYKLDPVSKWSSTPPWPKQRLFEKLECKEAFFGGAAGGGKSHCILRAALQYVDKPGYAALILRTSTTDLSLPGGLIPKSHEWLSGKAHWNGTEKRWTFPSGAMLQFGYLSDAQDKFRYRSSEFQYIGFDELTDFTEEDYVFMFSRIRQRLDIGVPERVRSASNPGGKGHDWVKARFIPKEMELDLVSNRMKEMYILPSRIEGETDAVSVPSKIKDNPAIDPAKYIRNLMHLGPVMRERMMNGDWTVMPTGLIKPHHLRYFTMRDKLVDLLISRKDGQGDMVHTSEVLHSFHEQECRRFITVDTAGGIEDIERANKGKTLSYTAAGVWDSYNMGSTTILMLKHVWRVQGVGYSEIRTGVLALQRAWKASMVHVENKAMGPAVVDDLKRIIPIQMISSGIVDKVVRAAPFLNMLENGQVYLPWGENSWRMDLESEWLRWLGLKDETNDQIDMASYAAIVSGGFNGGDIVLAVDPRKGAVEHAMDESSDRDRYRRSTFGGGMMSGWIGK